MKPIYRQPSFWIAIAGVVVTGFLQSRHLVAAEGKIRDLLEIGMGVLVLLNGFFPGMLNRMVKPPPAAAALLLVFLLPLAGCGSNLFCGQLKQAEAVHAAADLNSAKLQLSAAKRLREADCDAVCRDLMLRIVEEQAGAVGP